MAVADFSRINSNIGALNALNSLSNVNNKLGMYQTRLATGKRINSAADDPAGLTIATTFRQRNENLKVSLDNIGDAKNLLSVAEGGLGKVQDILLEMRNKAEAAASDTLGSSERTAISDQLKAYAAEIDDIVGQTTWNGKKLLSGLTGSDSFGGKITFQTGAEVNDTTSLTSAEFEGVDIENLLGAAYVSATAATASGSNFAAGTTTLAQGDLGTLGTTGTMAAGLSELSTGSYTLRVNITDNNASDGATIQLLDSSGTPKLLNDSGTLVTALTVGTDAAAGNIDFGNGFTLTGVDLSGGSNGLITMDIAYNAGDEGYKFDVSSSNTATTVMEHLDLAIDTVSKRQQTVGTLASRLSFKEENLASAQINTEAAYNRIMNADMAMSQLEATKYQILQQTATSMLAQANQAPQGLLSLFR